MLPIYLAASHPHPWGTSPPIRFSSVQFGTVEPLAAIIYNLRWPVQVTRFLNVCTNTPVRTQQP